MGEFVLYLAALFILSDVVRYQGQWKRLLDDHPEEALLVDRFLLKVGPLAGALRGASSLKRWLTAVASR
jgi:hypothetical protein